MKIPRYFTTAGKSPYDGIEFEARKSEIRSPEATLPCSLHGERDGADELVAGSHRHHRPKVFPPKPAVPQSDGTLGSETDSRQVFHRLAGCWRHWGEEHKYFATKEDSQAFYDELCHMLSLDKSGSATTPLSGSIPAFTLPTELPAWLKATTISTPRTMNLSVRSMLLTSA